MKIPFIIRVQLIMALAAGLPGFSISPARAASFSTNGLLNTARFDHTATLLPNGKVLVAGGAPDGVASFSSAELYDPAAGTWAVTGSLNVPREIHTATLLPSGKVLVAGGFNGSSYVSIAELYDPAAGTWAITGSLNAARWRHAAILLTNGQVLVAGGAALGSVLASAELFNPTNGTWTPTGSLNLARQHHTLTLLPGGKVLAAGGCDFGGLVNSFTNAEVYDPVAKTWTTINAMHTPRFGHTATLLPNGKVLVAGGNNTFTSTLLAGTELYDPADGSWTVSGSMSTGRYNHTATLLPNGKVLVTGGGGTGGSLASAEIYDPASGTWTSAGALATARQLHTATLLPGGEVMFAGGDNNAGAVASTEQYDPANGTWAATGPLAVARQYHTMTLLSDGTVMVAGGAGGFLNVFSSVELYAPAAGTWKTTNSMNSPRYFHTSTLLPNGKVLVAGGYTVFGGAPTNSAELYDPANGTWMATGSMATNRIVHTTTLLANGKVLVAGGYNGSIQFSNVEIYDPAGGTWTATGPLNRARGGHTATLLPNGKVLVAGGAVGNYPNVTNLSSAELYDPVAGTWTLTGALHTARGDDTATLLPNGKVLVAGGITGTTNILSSAELYDPSNGTWTVTGSLNAARQLQTATVLSSGKVLVAGGQGGGPLYPTLSSTEMYDPATGLWTAGSPLNAARYAHMATLLAGGKVLVATGIGNTAELYDVGLGFNPAWQPQVDSVTSPLALSNQLTLTGSQFRGIAEGSGGNNQDSPADYPLVQLRSVESGQTRFLSSTNWSANLFVSLPVTNFPAGWALATVFVNGIPSSSAMLLINPAGGPTAIILASPVRLVNGAIQFGFANVPGGSFTALTASNVELPAASWTVLGSVTEISPGQYQFTDSQATNNPLRFYRIRSP